MMDDKPTNFDYNENRKRFADLLNKDACELLAIIASKLLDSNYTIYTDRLSQDIAVAVLGTIARSEPDEYTVTVSARTDGVKKFRGSVVKRSFDMEDLRLDVLECAQELAGRIKSEIKEWELDGISVTVTKNPRSLLDG